MDLEYNIISNTVKENIILKSKAVNSEYSFNIKHKNLKANLEEDGTIGLYSGKDKVFTFAVPFAYDSNQIYTDLVKYELYTAEDESILTIKVDEDWLYDEERAFPVVIDPVTETLQTKENIADTFVASGAGYNSTPFSAIYGSIYAGKESSAYEDCYAYVKFNTLPTLSSGDMITDAYLTLAQFIYQPKNQNSTLYLSAHEVTGPWTEGVVTWNSKPRNSETILDYVKIDETQAYRNFNISKLVKNWYENGGTNYGIVIKSMESKYAYGQFFTKDYPFNIGNNYSGGPEYYPTGLFYYRNATGLESYWSYQEQSVGEAGTGYVNTFNGNLVFAHADASTSGTLSPASVSHVYNLTERNTDSPYGKGWRLSAVQTLKNNTNPDAQLAAKYPRVYTDGDGTKHYFYNNQGVYNDEDGLGLTYMAIEETSNSVNLKHKIVNKNGNEAKFDANGYLREMVDTNGNKTLYTYTGSNLTRITDPAGHQINFTYSNNKLTKIVDDVGRETTFAYDSNNLSYITTSDSTTTFTYSQNNEILCINNPRSNKIYYTYSNDYNASRVSKVIEISQNISLGRTMTFSYDTGMHTIVEECGLDGNIDNKADNTIIEYNFDKYGRCTDVYDKEGNASNYSYYTNVEGNGIKKNNSLLSSGSTQKTINNLLKDPYINSNVGSFWTAVESSVTRVTTDKYIGSGSIKASRTKADKTTGIYQKISLPAGTYTFSGYMKTNNIVAGAATGGATLIVTRSSVSGTTLSRSQVNLRGTSDSDVDNGWERLSTTFTLTATTEVCVFAGLYSASGTCYIDALQLESGDVANKVNIIRDSSFENSSEQVWSNLSGVGTLVDGGKIGTKAMKIAGVKDSVKSIYQTVNVSGSEGDIYSLSGWTKAVAKNKNDLAKYALEAEVIYTNGTSKKYTFDCNSNVNDKWQFINGCFSTDDNNASTNLTYSSIKIYLCYNYQINTALFDGIQLIKDNAQSYVYDNNGNLTSTTDAVNNTKYTYDGNSNLTKLNNPTGSSYNYIYDGKRNMATAIDSYGIQYSIAHDSVGNPVSSSYWEKFTAPSTSDTTQDGVTYYIKSVSAGTYLDVRRSFLEAGSSVIVSGLNKCENQKFTLKQCNVSSYYMIPNHAENMMVSHSGDVFGIYIKDYTAMTRKFAFVQQSSGNYSIRDFNGKKLAVVEGSITFVDSGATGTNTEWKLEKCGKHIDTELEYSADKSLLMSQKDSSGNETTYTYNSKKLLSTSKNAKNVTTSYSYDNDKLWEVSVSTANAGAATVEYSYDDAKTGKLSQIKRNELKYNLLYNDYGNLQQTKVGNQVLSTNYYLPNNGALSSSTYGNGNSIGYTYDDKYNVKSKLYNGATKVKYSYDSYGNLAFKNDLYLGKQTYYTYDLIGRLTNIKTDDAQSIGLKYDNYNRISSFISTVHDKKTKTTYTYGNLSNGESPDAIYKVNIDGRDVLSYNYDKLGRLSYDSLNCGNVTIDTDYGYADGYKADSTTTRVTSLFNGIVDLQYEYDVLGNISSVRDRFTNQTTRYEYDELGQLVCEHNPQLNKTIRYVYDNCGNIRIKREYALNAAADAIPTVAYSYLYDSTWSDKLVEYKGNAITYDAIGNPLNYRDNMTFTWRNGRQMATATKNNYSLSFKYDDNGIRTEKISTMQTNTTTTKTTTYYLNGSQILSQLTGTEQIDFMYDAGGEVIGLKFEGANYYYLKNLQGDILYVVDSSGQIVVKYDYDSWGKLRSTAGSMATTLGVKNPFRYRSYYYDTETGLYYLNSRYYDPDTGRFVNADGYFSTGQGILGNNMYTYCNNNPVILCDPSGTCALTRTVYVSIYNTRTGVVTYDIEDTYDICGPKPVYANSDYEVQIHEKRDQARFTVWPTGSAEPIDDYPSYPYGNHTGTDLIGATGDPVRAAQYGVVTEVVTGRGNTLSLKTPDYGNYIKIETESGAEMIYAHLSQVNVSVGQKVMAWDVIGAVGNTGFSDGAHLHFEVRVNGIHTYPGDYLPH